jgi:hypothetical protein
MYRGYITDDIQWPISCPPLIYKEEFLKKDNRSSKKGSWNDWSFSHHNVSSHFSLARFPVDRAWYTTRFPPSGKRWQIGQRNTPVGLVITGQLHCHDSILFFPTPLYHELAIFFLCLTDRREFPSELPIVPFWHLLHISVSWNSARDRFHCTSTW